MANELDQITGGLEENIALSNIRKQKAEEQANQHEQLRSEFDDYARGGTGEPLDMNRVEAYKNQVPSHMFQASLYKLQEETYPVGESFSTPILDQYVGDDPNAYKDYEAYDNRQASMNRAYRIKDYHYGMFTYDSRADYPNMNDEAYEIMSVGGYFSEMYNKPMDEVVKNMDTYVGMYGNQKNIKDPNIKSVFDQIKGEVFDMGESMKRDDQYWSEGLDMALRGDSIEKTVTGKLGTPEGDRQAQVYRMAADYIYGEYGNNIIKAKEYLTLLGEGDKRPETLDARKPSGAEVQGRLAMANQLMEESPEDRQEILSLIFKLAELEGEEVEGAVNRVAKSMQRAISGSIEDITSGSTKALLDPNVFIPAALEIVDDKIAEPLRQRTELMQDLRMARNIYKDIEAQGTGEMIAQTTAANIHYAGMFALGWAGFGAMALDMASKRDEQLRIEYPDMSPDTRWSISQADAVVDASLERFKYKMVFSGFPTLTKFVGGTGVRRAAGVFGVRVASAQATNYAEEVAQNMTNPIFHKMWVAAGADIPDVTQEDWDRNFWMMEDGDKVPFIDGELFVSLLGMSMLGAGGRGAYDKFGGANVKRILDEKDKLLLQGFPEAQADAIIKANQTDTTKAFEMFQDGLEDMSQQERRANMNQAKADGADRRVLKAELDEYKQRVEEDGTEDDKVNLRVREAQFDFAMKYDAHLEEREDGRWDFVSPNTDVAPNQTFETKEQADEAMLQHYQKVDQMFLGAMAEQAQRIDAMPKNKEAMKLAVKELKEAQAKAGVEADIALDQDLTTLAEFGAQSKKNMEIALERVQHELLRKNILRPATVKDLEAWTINAQVTLAKNGRGYVQKVAKGGNIADVYEDASEGFLKTMIHKDVVSKDWVKDQLFKYQKDSGDSVKWGFKSVEDITDGRMVEAFSDLAKANLWNASKDNKMGKLSSLIRALKQFFKSILDAAESLLKLQAEGKIDTDFQTLLDQSVGLNMDEQIARQTEEVRQEILGDVEGASLSVTPEMTAEEKQIGEGADTEAGTPAPDSPAETIKPDDSKPEIDWSDPSYSVSPKSLPEVFPLMTEELANQILSETDTTSAIHIDRMRVGEFEGVPLQGGMFYPSIVENLESRIAWAFNSIGVARTVVDRAAQHGGYVKLVLMTEGNVVGNKTFATIWLNRMDNILNTEEKKAEFMDEFHKVRKAAIKSIVNKKRNAEKKANEAAEKKGEKPAEPVDEMTLATYHRDGEKVTSYDQVREFMLDMGQSDRGSHYLTRGTQGKATKVRAKGETIYGKLLGAQLSAKRGYPDAKEIVEAIEEPAFKGMKKGDVVGLIKLDAIEKGSPIQTATEAGVTEHLSYNYVVKGEPVAKMKNIHNIEDMYPSIAGQMMSQQNKSYDAKEHITFSIGRASAEDTLAPQNEQEQKAFDKASKFKDRNPFLAVAATRLRNKDINRQEFREIVDRVDPFMVKGVEDIPSIDRIAEFLIASKSDKLGLDVEEGSVVELRIDIPTYNASLKADPSNPVYAVTLHEKTNSKDKAGAVLAYHPAAHITNPEFFARPTAKASAKNVGALSIAEGGGKFPLATVRGELVTTDPKALPSKEELKTWAEVGYNPTRSSEFRDVRNGKIVSGGVESVSIGSRVYVKDPVYQSEDSLGEFGDGNISFSIAPAEDAVMERITALMRDPDAKLAVYKNMASRLNKVRERIYTKQIAFGEVTEDAMREADREMDERAFIISSVAQVEAIAGVLPKSIRAEIGSMSALVKSKTFRGASTQMIKKIEMAEKALEKYLVKQYRDKISKLQKRALGKVDPKTRKKKGTIGQVGHTVAQEAEEAKARTAEEANIEIIKLRAEIDTLDLDSDEGVIKFYELDGKILANDLMHDYDGADSSRLKDAVDFLSNNYGIGRQNWLNTIKERKAQKDSRVNKWIKNMGKKPTRSDIKKSKDEFKGVKGKARWLNEALVQTLGGNHHYMSRMLENSKDKKQARQIFNEAFDARIKAEVASEREREGIQNTLFGFIAKLHGQKKMTKHFNRKFIYETQQKEVEDHGVTQLEGRETVQINLSKASAQSYIAGDIKSYQDNDLTNATSKAFKGTKVTKQDTIAMQRALDESGSKDKVIKFTRVKSKGKRSTVGSLTQGQALNLWLTMRQPDQFEKLESIGYDQQTLDELDKFLTDDTKAVGLYMVSVLKDMGVDLRSLHASEYGINMGDIFNYFPVKNIVDSENQDLQEQQSVINQGMNPVAVKVRVANKADPDTSMDAIAVFLAHVAEMTYWKNNVEWVREWGGVFRDHKFAESAKVNIGNKAYQNLIGYLDRISNGGRAKSDQMLESERFMRVVNRKFALGVLGMRLSTVFVNSTAFLNPFGTGEVSARSMIKNMVKMAFDGKGELKATWANDLQVMRREYGASFEASIAMSKDFNQHWAFQDLDALAQIGLQPMNYADVATNSLVIASIYRAVYDESIEMNMSKEQAGEEAQKAVSRAVATLAQPVLQSSRSWLEQKTTSNPFLAIVTMFRSEVRKNAGNNYFAWRALLTGKGLVDRKTAARQATLYTVVYPAVVVAFREILNAIVKDEDDDDFWSRVTSWEYWTYQMAGDSVRAVPIFGDALMGIVGNVTDQRTYAQQTPIESVIRKGMKWSDVLKTDADLTASEKVDAWIDGAQASTLLPAGVVLAQVANVAETAKSAFAKDSETPIIDQVFNLGKSYEEFKLLELAIKGKKEIYKDVVETSRITSGQRDKIRWRKTAEVYQEIKNSNPELWGNVSKRLKEKNHYPKAIDRYMRK